MKRKSLAWFITFALALTTAALAQGGGVLGEAGQSARRPTRAVSGPSADQVVRQYLEAWSKKDFDTMYSLTTKEGQREIAKEEFIQLLSKPQIFDDLLKRGHIESYSRGGRYNTYKGIRVIAVYPPEMNGDIASIAFTVELVMPDDSRLPNYLQRATAYVVVDDNQWRLPMYFNEQSKSWHLPPTAMPPETGGMMPGEGPIGMPGMGGMGGVTVGRGGLGGFGGGAMGGVMGPPDSGIRTVIIPVRNVDVTSIAALFGVGGQPMGGMPGMPGMPGMGGMGGMPGMPGMPDMPEMPGGMGGRRGRGGAVSPPPRVTKGTQNKVSVDFKNVDIREVIDSLFKIKPGTNYDVKEGVQGLVTLKLNDVDWDLALKFAVEKVKARARKDDNGVFIIEPDPKFQQGLAPPAGGIPMMGAMPSRPASPAPFAIGSLALPPGVVNIVALVPRNALLVQGTEEGIVQLRVIIEELDALIDQIALEVMLLEMASEDLKELTPSNQPSNVLTPQQVRTALQRLGSKAKVLSKPQVTTLNGIPTEISVSVTPAGNPTGRGSFRLHLTPRTQRDGMIWLHATAEVGFNPPGGINTLSTSVTVQNGYSVVLNTESRSDGKATAVIITPRIVTPAEPPPARGEAPSGKEEQEQR